LVEPYRVALSIDLEENLKFHVFDNIFINVHTDVLYVVLKSSGQAQVDEDDTDVLYVVLKSSGQAQVDEDDDSNVEDCIGADDESIEEEEDNSD